MPDEPAHIVPGGRPALRAPARPEHRRHRLRHRAHAPFLPEHGVARPGLVGHVAAAPAGDDDEAAS